MFLKNVFDILVPIMFADDTNLYYSHRSIEAVYTTLNGELNRIGKWFKTKKLSLNIKNTKYAFFHKNSVKDDIHLKSPELKIANKIIKKKVL